jgi:beta-mannosidase
VAEFSATEANSYHDLVVQNPILWWPHGIGKPHIYDYTVQLFKVEGKVLVDQRAVPFGIRTVSLDLSAKKFQVVVNGYAVYCKGANYVPPDMFYPRL